MEQEPRTIRSSMNPDSNSSDEVWVEANGETISALIDHPKAGSGPGILIFPTLGASKEEMFFLSDFFVKAGFVTLRLDLLGSGQSSGVLTLDAEKFFKAVISDFLERREVSFSKIIAIGISFGAYWMIRTMAIDHRVAGGIGISIPVFHQDQWDSLEEGDWLRFQRCFHQSTVEATRPIVTKMTLYGVIDQVHSPLLAFHGGKDTMNHPESSEILKKHARGPLTLEVFPEEKHGCLGKIRKEILPKAVEWSREIIATFEDQGMENLPVT